MKISLFEELAVPRPWDEESESRAFRERLEQLQLADKVGIHAAWLPEHHFLEEYCHSSAPDLLLATLAATTSQLRLGHGIVHLPPGINHPARVAERAATLDVLSGGRVELGTGESSSTAELDGFHVDPGRKREMWREGLEVLVGCMSDTPFSGFEGDFVTMPPRNVVPKPLQRPHPPLWVACTRKDTMTMAAENGLGALVFAFLGPEVFGEYLQKYYETLAERCVPAGRSVNANVLCTSGALLCAPSGDKAVKMLGNSARFFGYGIRHYYAEGTHKPGKTDVWAAYERDLKAGRVPGNEEIEQRGVGSPAKLRDLLRKYEEIGVDQVAFITPPMVAHEDVMESLDLLGREVLPEFIDRDEAAVEEKRTRLEPVIEAAMARRPPPREMDEDYEFGSVPVAWDLMTPVTEVVESTQSRIEDLARFEELKKSGKIVIPKD